MRAWEILENRNPPSKPVTLRALHQLKHEKKARDESERQRLELIPRIYGNPARRQEQLEIQRLELELEQLRLQVQSDSEAASYEEISRMAKSGTDAMQKSQKRLTDMARSDLGRRKKK